MGFHYYLGVSLLPMDTERLCHKYRTRPTLNIWGIHKKVFATNIPVESDHLLQCWRQLQNRFCFSTSTESGQPLECLNHFTHILLSVLNQATLKSFGVIYRKCLSSVWNLANPQSVSAWGSFTDRLCLQCRNRQPSVY